MNPSGCFFSKIQGVLAISKSLAQGMGGEVGVQSKYGEGATFWFTAVLGLASEEKILTRPSVDLHGRRQEFLKGAQMLGVEYVLTKPISASLLVNTMMQLAGHATNELSAVHHVKNSSTSEAALAPLAGARILLVEDNDINQLVACELLRGVGLVVDVANNG
jgi:CheY-like chemotaxis protein